MNMRDKIAAILDQSFGPFSDGIVDRMARYVVAALPDYDAQQARIGKLEAANILWRRNMRDSFDAMCAMRNDINDVVLLPSLESDLLQGPETSVFCVEVAFSVVGKVKAQQARIDKLEAIASAGQALAELMKGWNVEPKSVIDVALKAYAEALKGPE